MITPRTLVDRARGFLRSRRNAYRRLFDLESQDAQIVLADLDRCCRATQTTVTPDDRASLVLEGRREVWLRLQQHLQMDEESLWRLVDGRPTDTTG